MDTPGEDGVSKRAKLEKVKKDTRGKVVPQPLLDEIKPQPEDESLFDMFFELYSPETNFYMALDAYCNVWDFEISGEDITFLQLLWRETDKWHSANMKKKVEKNKGSGNSSPKKTRPSAGKPRRR